MGDHIDAETPRVQVSRRHHYVPQFYSKQWCGNDGRLCEFSRPYREVIERRKYPSETGYQIDLYTVPGAPNGISTYIEDQFLKLSDQRANDALQLLLTNRMNDMDEVLRSGWARFIMTQLQRTPQKVAWLLNAWNSGFDPESSAAADEYPKLRGPNDPATFDEYVRLNAERLRAVGATKMLQAVMDLPNTGTHLVRMVWTIATFREERFELLTSDRPVIISDGLLKPDSHVVIPIAPDRLFIATNSKEVVPHLIGPNPKSLIQRCNDLVVRQAHTYAYGTDASQLRFIENRLGHGTPQLLTSNLPINPH